MSRINEIVNRIAQIKDQLEAVKPLYEELDALTVEFTQCGYFGNKKFATDEATPRFVSIVDNFSEKNTVFRPAGVKRFESVLQTQEDIEKENAKLEKAAKKAAKEAKE
jgi:hypothetical protein